MFSIGRFKQLAVLTNTNAIGAAASYFLTIYIANVLGSEQFGQYSYVLIVSSIATIFISYSTDQTAGVMFAKGVRIQHIFNLIITIRTIIFFLSGAIIMFIFRNNHVVLTGALILGISTFNLSFLYEIKGHNDRYSYAFLVERLLYTLIVYVLFKIGVVDVMWVFTIYLVVTSLSILFQFFVSRTHIRNYSIPPIKEVKDVLLTNFFLVVISLSAYVYGGYSRIIVEQKLGLVALGIFSSGMQITTIISIFQAQVERVWRLPLYNSLASKNVSAFKSLLKDYFKNSTVPSVLLFVFVYIFGDYIVDLVYNDEYNQLRDVLPLVSFFFVLINLNSLCTILWIGLKATREYLIVSVVFSSLLVIILYLIPGSVSLNEYVWVILIIQLSSIIYSFLRTYKLLIFQVYQGREKSD